VECPRERRCGLHTQQTVVGLVSAMNVFPLESAAAAAVASMAAAKCALPTGTAFVKGVGANWLVAVAIYQAATAKTTPGKVRCTGEAPRRLPAVPSRNGETCTSARLGRCRQAFFELRLGDTIT
jgi:hypothetical protein